MAALTYTATSTTATRLNERGVTYAVATYVHNGATSLSASDVIYMVKVPTGCLILDGYISGTAGGDAMIFDVGIIPGGSGGTSLTDNNLAAALTFSETAAIKRFNAALPLRISTSDDAVPYNWVQLTRTSGTSTATASLVIVVAYAPVSVSAP